jgi:hypothetical protein
VGGPQVPSANTLSSALVTVPAQAVVPGAAATAEPRTEIDPELALSEVPTVFPVGLGPIVE